MYNKDAKLWCKLSLRAEFALSSIAFLVEMLPDHNRARLHILNKKVADINSKRRDEWNL